MAVPIKPSSSVCVMVSII